MEYTLEIPPNWVAIPKRNARNKKEQKKNPQQTKQRILEYALELPGKYQKKKCPQQKKKNAEQPKQRILEYAQKKMPDLLGTKYQQKKKIATNDSRPTISENLRPTISGRNIGKRSQNFKTSATYNPTQPTNYLLANSTHISKSKLTPQQQPLYVNYQPFISTDFDQIPNLPQLNPSPQLAILYQAYSIANFSTSTRKPTSQLKPYVSISHHMSQLASSKLVFQLTSSFSHLLPKYFN